MLITDLHLHSKYSRATSRDCDLRHLDLWSRNKGISLLGTGDFTHPQWRKEIEEFLVPAEEGLYTLRDEMRLPALVSDAPAPRFVLSGEISTIYKKDGRTRKVHHVILLPSLEAAGRLSRRLEEIGNLHSDGRPILGLDSRDLLAITLDVCPEAILIPAHIWTPHFSMLGAFSGFDSIEECYGDLAGEIHAVETGLSSDPPMNRSVSALDSLLLISNSDAHSPAKLGREANLLSCALSYEALAHTLRTGEGFEGTLEFFPEEGKYHLDGHRSCQVCLQPAETRALENRCPVCGKKITVGVQHRVFDLSDRTEEEALCRSGHFESLIPLQEVIGNALGRSGESKAAVALYEKMLRTLGTEFDILRRTPFEDIERCAGICTAEAIRRMRSGEVRRIAGYDGEYGIIRLLEKEELEKLSGQISLLSPLSLQETPKAAPPLPKKQKKQEEADMPLPRSLSPNAAQEAAITSSAAITAVIAGPGSGKTKTLIGRIEYLIREKNAAPQSITAITFTRQAASELRRRLEESLGKECAEHMTIGTFHAVCRALLPPLPIVDADLSFDLMEKILRTLSCSIPVREALEKVSRIKGGASMQETGLPEEVYARYQEAIRACGVRDLDDLLLDALALEDSPKTPFTHLLVDEFQDINPLQLRLIQHWRTLGETLFVIGDPDQSIYGFRGASAACFDALLNHAQNAALLTLEENYRSSPEILEAALSVISKNPGRERPLRAVRASSQVPVRLLQASSSHAEAIWVGEEIARMTGGIDMLQAHHLNASEEKTRSFSEIAVLCRTHYQLEKIENQLRKQGIPCMVSGRGSWLEDEEVEGVISFLRLLCEKNNLPALQTCLRRLWHLSAEAIASILETWQEGGDFSATACPAEFLQSWARLFPRREKDSPEKLLRAFLQNRKMTQPLEYLLDAAHAYATLDAFLQSCLCAFDGDLIRSSSRQSGGGAVRLMTLHASKGLEFPVVFLCGAEEEQLPLIRKGRPCDLLEERRLFFVGMTRAKEELLISCGAAPSPFFQELPQTLQNRLERIRSTPRRAVQLDLFSSIFES